MTSRIDSKVLSNVMTTPMDDFRPRPCQIRSLHHDCANWFTTRRQHFARPVAELLQSFALHPQFHLRILFEDLRVSLAKHLSRPIPGTLSGSYPPATAGRSPGGSVVLARFGNASLSW